MSERWGRDRIAEVHAEDPSERSNGGPAAPTAGSATPALPARNGSAAPAVRPTTGKQLTTLPAPGGNGTTAGGSRSVSTPRRGNGTPPGSRRTAGNEATENLIIITAVVVVAAVAGASSYEHLRTVARLAGEGGRAALFPLSVDGLLTAATTVMLTRRRQQQPAGVITWIALVLGLTASVAGNVLGANPTLITAEVIGPPVAAWPPIALLLSLELLMRQISATPRSES